MEKHAFIGRGLCYRPGTGTNFPNNRRIERQHGRVPKLEGVRAIEPEYRLHPAQGTGSGSSSGRAYRPDPATAGAQDPASPGKEGLTQERSSSDFNLGSPLHSPLLEMRGIDKRYPGVDALKQVDLTLEAREVLALMGEDSW